MRIECPNCATRYEVADSAIPPAGRTVQCGSCRTSWFQSGAAAQAALPPGRRSPLPRAPSAPPPAPPAASPAPVSATIPPARAPIREDWQTDFDAPEDEEEEPDTAPTFRPLTRGPGWTGPSSSRLAEADVADERRMEADLHGTLNRRPPQAPKPAPAEAVAAAKVEPVRAEGTRLEPARPAPAAPAPREPPATAEAGRIDIRPPEDAPARRARGRFTGGFLVAACLCTLLGAAYVLHPQIIDSVPESAAVLTPYVAAVDSLRLSVQDLWATIAALTGLSTA